MIRKIGCPNVLDVESQEDFDQAIAAAIDPYSGMAGLLGKAALPKILIDLIIVDWDTPAGGAIKLIKTMKAKFSGHYRFLLVADKRHFNEMSTALKAGATDFILKPFTMSDFNEKMGNVLSDKPLTVQSFSMGAASEKSKKVGYGVNPFAVDKIAPDAPKAETPSVAAKPEAFPAAPRIEPRIKPKFAPPAAGTVGGGASFYTSSAGKRRHENAEPTATLIDGKIDGHYHEKVDVIGGGENCYWAKEMENGKVRLEYLSAKGTPTGMQAKIIDRDDFMFTFYLCEEYGCNLLRRLGQWPPPGYDEAGNKST